MYAYVGPSPGTYTDSEGKTIVSEDFRTIERYQEYKDCGFDTLLLLGNDKYVGEEFETSDLKKNLDMALKVGLKVLVFDQRIHDYSCKSESNIGEGKEFADMDEFKQAIYDCMKPYMDHPAFWGLSLKDEPWLEHFDAMAEVVQALKIIDKNIFPHTITFPYLEGTTPRLYTGRADGNPDAEAYTHYVDEFLRKANPSYIAYDNYPFYEDFLLSTYYENLQIVTDEAKKYGVDAWLAIQSAAWSIVRAVQEEDLRYQCNSALAFGIKNIQYYTYWQFPDGSHSQGIIAHDGTKMIYDETQRVNMETQKMAKVILNFDYEKAQFVYDREHAEMPPLFQNLRSEELDFVNVISVTEATMISQMKDAQRECMGYMVVNATDPIKRQTSKVAIRIGDCEHVTAFTRGEAEIIDLLDGVLELDLEPGGGVFVIPHKK